MTDVVECKAMSIPSVLIIFLIIFAWHVFFVFVWWRLGVVMHGHVHPICPPNDQPRPVWPWWWWRWWWCFWWSWWWAFSKMVPSKTKASSVILLFSPPFKRWIYVRFWWSPRFHLPPLPTGHQRNDLPDTQPLTPSHAPISIFSDDDDCDVMMMMMILMMVIMMMMMIVSLYIFNQKLFSFPSPPTLIVDYHKNLIRYISLTSIILQYRI